MNLLRLVRRDGTVSYDGARFEVPYELCGRKVELVVDPHTARVIGVEDEDGKLRKPGRGLSRFTGGAAAEAAKDA